MHIHFCRMNGRHYISLLLKNNKKLSKSACKKINSDTLPGFSYVLFEYKG